MTLKKKPSNLFPLLIVLVLVIMIGCSIGVFLRSAQQLPSAQELFYGTATPALTATPRRIPTFSVPTSWMTFQPLPTLPVMCFDFPGCIPYTRVPTLTPTPTATVTPTPTPTATFTPTLTSTPTPLSFESPAIRAGASLLSLCCLLPLLIGTLVWVARRGSPQKL